MAKFNFKKRHKAKLSWKGILAAALSLLVLTGAILGIAKLTGNEMRSVGGLSFSVGGLETGTGEVKKEEKATIFTKEKIECQGLTIVPAEGAESKYQVFFYNEDDKFIECTWIRNDSFDPAEIPSAAKYARVVIYPSVLDENGKIIENYRVYLWDVFGIANDFDISVYKKQLSLNILDSATVVKNVDACVFPPVSNVLIEDVVYDSSKSDWSSIVTEEDNNILLVDVTDLAQLKVAGTYGEDFRFFFLTASGSGCGIVSFLDDEARVIDVPNSASFALVSFADGAEVVVTEYMPR